MSGPGRYEIRLYRGDDWTLQVSLTDGNDNPVDLTGWTARAQVRRNDFDTTALADIGVTISGSHIDLRLTSAQSAAMTSGGVWDLEVTDPGGLVRTLLAGPVRFTADVTR